MLQHLNNKIPQVTYSANPARNVQPSYGKCNQKSANFKT